MDTSTVAPVLELNNAALVFAREHVSRQVEYSFTEDERAILSLFVSNTDRHTFLFGNMPSNVEASLMAMYSRLKNPRGVRGILVDVLVPVFLASMSERVSNEVGEETEKYLKNHEINSLADLFEKLPYSRHLFGDYIAKVTGDPEYIKKFANGRKVKGFFKMYLDGYGHTSIARMGNVRICCEQISLIAAKAIEHLRAGAGFIELSTRFVDMKNGAAASYDIAGELEARGYGRNIDLQHYIESVAKTYQSQMETYAEFLQGIYPDASASAVFGETCDVLGNLLLAATTTSVGVALSGEAAQRLIWTLKLEGLPETTALAEAILGELEGTGLDQFVRHTDPTDYDRRHVHYLPIERWKNEPFDGDRFVVGGFMQSPEVYERELSHIIGRYYNVSTYQSFEKMMEEAGLLDGRGDHDKLPAIFEAVVLEFGGLMSFRSWRDLQRHVFSSNERSLLTPFFGFYRHTKPISKGLQSDFDRTSGLAADLHGHYVKQGAPLDVLQYLLPIGFNVWFTHLSSFRQLDFEIWQRSKPGVNHEVRQVVLQINKKLEESFQWWARLVRVDRTPAYRLGREKVPVPTALID